MPVAVRLGSKVHIGYYDQEHQVLHMEKTSVRGNFTTLIHNMDNTQIRNVPGSLPLYRG